MGHPLQSVLDGFRRHFDRVRGLSFTPAQHISWRRATASRALFDELRSAWIARLDRQLGASARERIPLILREPWVGVLDVFGKEEDENAHSDVLRWLLDPFCASTVAPQLLRRLIGAAAKDAESLWRTVELAIARGSFSAVREERLDPECRIDILLATPDVFIAIENKVNSREHGSQTCRYARWLSARRERSFGIYLSPLGTPPEAPSFVPLSYLQLFTYLVESISSPSVRDSERQIATSYMKSLATGVLRMELRALGVEGCT